MYALWTQSEDLSVFLAFTRSGLRLEGPTPVNIQSVRPGTVYRSTTYAILLPQFSHFCVLAKTEEDRQTFTCAHCHTPPLFERGENKLTNKGSPDTPPKGWIVLARAIWFPLVHPVMKVLARCFEESNGLYKKKKK